MHLPFMRLNRLTRMSFLRMRWFQIIAFAVLFGIGAQSQAAKVELEKNASGSYDLVVTLDPSDPAVYAADLFVRRLAGAQISEVDKEGSPFDIAVANLTPAGKPDTILVGGSNIQGNCKDAAAQRCFDNTSCGESGPCVWGARGPVLRLAELKWDGKGALALDPSSTALALVAGQQTDIQITVKPVCTAPDGLPILAGADANADGTIDACQPARPANPGP